MLSLVDQEIVLTDLFSIPKDDGQHFRKYAVRVLQATYLPKPGSSNTADTKITEGSFSWVYHLVDLVEPSRSLDTAIFAFCLAQLYATRLGHASLDQCHEQYTAALGHLRLDLDDPETRFQEETLAAILVLTTCELFISSTEDGWAFHLPGIIEILRMRDPEVSSTTAWRDLLSRFRVVCIINALTTRRSHIIEDEIWRQTLFKPGMGDGLHKVFQIISDIPILLEKTLTIPTIDDPETLFLEGTALIQALLAITRSLRTWHDGFWRASPTPRAWLVPSRATNSADTDPSKKIFPLCFEFESIDHAIPIFMCWAVLVQLYSNIIQLLDAMQLRLGRRLEVDNILARTDLDLSDVTGKLYGLPENKLTLHATTSDSTQKFQNEGTEMAYRVCQSLEYCHRIEMGTYGCQATTYTTWSARQYFRLHPGHDREALWLQEIDHMKGPDTRWGVSTMRFTDIDKSLEAMTK